MPLYKYSGKQVTSIKSKRTGKKYRLGPKDKKIINIAANKAIRGQLHYSDTVVSSAAVSYDVPHVQVLTDIPQGDQESQMTGSQAKICSLQILMDAYRNTSSTTADKMSIVLVRAMDSSAAPTWSDIYNASGASGNDTRAMARRGARDRFTVLKRWDFNFGHAIASSNAQKHLEVYKRFRRPLEVNFTVSGHNLRAGHLYLVAISNVVSTGFTPTLNYTSRVNFEA